MTVAMSRAVAGLAVGVALAGAPGPVQAVILGEAVRGGVRRGVRAMLGAHAVTGVVLIGLALGLSVAPPQGTVLRVFDVLGGAVLLWLAVDALRSPWGGEPAAGDRRGLPAPVRGGLSVLLNPGAWVFFATVASSLLSAAARLGGRAAALSAAGGLLIGLVAGDGTLVVVGGAGIRRGGLRAVRWAQRVLAVALFGLGLWLVWRGVRG